MSDSGSIKPPDEPTATTPLSEPQPTPAPERKLVRRPEGKMIAGVCTGLGAYTGVDPVAWRIGFVVLTLLTGVGLIAYVVAWLVMPMARAGDPFPPPPSDPTRLRRWVGVGAVILGAIVLFRNTFNLGGAVFWGLLLVGLGLALWGWEFSGRGEGSRPRVPAPPPAPPAPPLGGGEHAPPPTPPRTTTPAASTAPGAPPLRSGVAPSQRRREPSMLGRLVVGAAALAVGGALLLGNLGYVDVTARGVLLVLLVITGVGLLVGSLWGRARWLVFPGVALVVALAGVTYVPTDTDSAFGNVTWQPRSESQVEREYSHSFGNAVLDLSQLEVDEDETVRVRTRFGNLEVIVPADVPVIVRASPRFGNLEIFGREYTGIRRRGAYTDSEPGDPGRDPNLGKLTLVVDAAFGNAEIRRPRPGDAFIEEQDDRVRVRVGPGSVDVRTGDD